MTLDIEELKKQVEAIIFSAGRVVELEEFLNLIKGVNPKDIEHAAKEVKKEYEDRKSPLLVTPEGKGWKLTVREKYLSLVQQINPHTELSKQVIATLAVIAWKSPALQSEVIKIRTNKAYDHIKELEDLGFISKEKKGRSFVLKATGKFFEYFDLPTKEAAQKMFEEIAQKYPIEDEEKAKDIQKKLGDLEVVEIKEQPKGGIAIQRHDTEHLGPLEIYEEKKSSPARDVHEYGEEEEDIEGREEQGYGAEGDDGTDEDEAGEEGSEDQYEDDEIHEGDSDEDAEDEEDAPKRKLHPELEHVLKSMPDEDKEESKQDDSDEAAEEDSEDNDDGQEEDEDSEGNDEETDDEDQEEEDKS